MSAEANLDPSVLGVIYSDEPRVRPAQPESKQHRFEFTGSANEYFRIWIVNVLLSVVTLGIYAAWAKVRTRQYFYANTKLDGHAFEYRGNPISILKGNILLALFLGVYNITARIEPTLNLLLLGIGAALFPWLIWQSVRFMASNTSYRNIRFRFHGTLGGAYRNYLLWPIGIMVSLGFLTPRALFNQRAYMYGNAAYGTSKNEFRGGLEKFGEVYWKAVGLSILLYVGLIIMIGLFGGASVFVGGLARADQTTRTGLLALLVPVYLAFGALSLFVQQFMQVNLFNHAFSSCEVPGKLRFSSGLDVGELTKLRVVNFIAIVCSLGLLSAWAKVRYVEYVLSKTTVTSLGDMDDFAAAETDRENALGDAATDYLNFDFGL
jgi:uncharacterized membrane protein YjgN (DUF898 family)